MRLSLDTPTDRSPLGTTGRLGLSRGLVAAVLMLSLAAGAAEQFAVKGSAKDESGKPLTGATVQLTGADGGKFAATTDNRGEFRLTGVPKGRYAAVLIVDGKTVEAFADYPVIVGSDNVLNFDLKERTVSEADRRRQQQAMAYNERIRTLNQALNQASAARQAGDYARAIALLKEAADFDPSQDVIWASLGYNYLSAGQAPESVAAVKRAVELKPERADYRNLLGVAALRNRQTADAAAEFKQAAELNDKLPADAAQKTNAASYWYNLGAALSTLGKVDEAVAAFDKAIAAEPEKAEAYYQKGVTLLSKASVDASGKMQVPAGVEDALNTYLRLSPDGSFADTARQMLAAVGAKVETDYGSSRRGRR